MDEIISLEDFVATYHDGVKQYNGYNTVQRLKDRNTLPEIAGKIEMAIGTVQRYTNGYRPRCLNGAKKLEELGLLPLNTDNQHFRTINYASAWVLFSGSIDEYYNITFSGKREQLSDLRKRLETVGVTGYSVRERSALRLSTSGQLIGRMLVAMGLPHNTLKADYDIQLPNYLQKISDTVYIDDYIRVLLKTRMNKVKDKGKVINYWSIFLPRNAEKRIAERFATEVLDMLETRIPGLEGRLRIKRSPTRRKGVKYMMWDPIIGINRDDVHKIKERFPDA